VRLRRRFLWSPLSVAIALESERGRFEPAAVAGVADIVMEKDSQGATGEPGTYVYLISPTSERELMPDR